MTGGPSWAFLALPGKILWAKAREGASGLGPLGDTHCSAGGGVTSASVRFVNSSNSDQFLDLQWSQLLVDYGVVVHFLPLE